MDTNVMDEQAPTPPMEAPASGEAPVSAPVHDEQKLERLLKRLLQGLVAVVAIFAVVYFFGQRQDHVEQAAPKQDVALVAAEQAVRDKPNDLAVRLDLASQYANAGRLDDALTQLREILNAQADYRPALLGSGEILFQQGKFEEAREALLKYVRSVSTGEFAAEDPKLEYAYYLLGKANAELGDTAAAVSNFQKALDIDSADADSWYELGVAQLDLKAYSDAVNALNRAIAFVPTGWCEPFASLESAYRGLGIDEGATLASARYRICDGAGMASAEPLKALVNGPFGAEALFGLGLAAEADDDTQAAIGYYQQVLTLDRTHIAALTALSRLGVEPDPKPIPEKNA